MYYMISTFLIILTILLYITYVFFLRIRDNAFLNFACFHLFLLFLFWDARVIWPILFAWSFTQRKHIPYRFTSFSDGLPRR